MLLSAQSPLTKLQIFYWVIRSIYYLFFCCLNFYFQQGEAPVVEVRAPVAAHAPPRFIESNAKSDDAEEDELEDDEEVSKFSRVLLFCLIVFVFH